MIIKIDVETPRGYYDLWKERHLFEKDIFTLLGAPIKSGENAIMLSFKDHIKQLIWGSMLDDKKRIETSKRRTPE